MIPAWNQFADVWAGGAVRASWQGGLAIVIAWAVQRLWTSLSPRVVCWIWRLACLKLLISLVWSQPVPLAILPAQMQETPPPVRRVETVLPRDWAPPSVEHEVVRPQRLRSPGSHYPPQVFC